MLWIWGLLPNTTLQQGCELAKVSSKATLPKKRYRGGDIYRMPFMILVASFRKFFLAHNNGNAEVPMGIPVKREMIWVVVSSEDRRTTTPTFYFDVLEHV